MRRLEFFWDWKRGVGRLSTRWAGLHPELPMALQNGSPGVTVRRRTGGIALSESVEQSGGRPAIGGHAKFLLFLLNGDAGAGAKNAVDLADIVAMGLQLGL